MKEKSEEWLRGPEEEYSWESSSLIVLKDINLLDQPKKKKKKKKSKD